jgi:antirestriction protein
MKMSSISLFMLFVSVSLPVLGTKKVEVDETIDSISELAQKMFSYCKQNAQEGYDNCIQKYSNQHQEHLVRKYTERCAQCISGKKNHNSSEQWAYKDEDDLIGQCKDLMATNEAYSKWKNPEIKNCAEEALGEYARRAQSSLKRANIKKEELNGEVEKIKRELERPWSERQPQNLLSAQFARLKVWFDTTIIIRRK